MIHSLLLSLALLPSVLAASADDWHKRSIYQVVTDRFANSDDSNPACDPSKRTYCGGSYKGIENKLDYIQGMGFDAIWISPVVSVIDGTTGYGEAYHGYWPKDFNSLNTKLGSEDDLKSLVSAIHKRSMYIMVDVVVNHVGSSGSSPSFSSFSPFNSESQYHTKCFVKDYGNQTEVEQCWLGDDTVALVDINTEDDNNVSTLNSWISKLVSDYSFDGVRIDTVKHIRKDFWPNFVKAAGVFAIGEVLTDSTDYMKGYTEVLDGVLDYPTYFSLTSAFKNTSGDLSALQTSVTSAQKSYKNGEFMTGSFLENHDYARFGSLTQDKALVKNAMVWPFVHDGIPILYYGQEQGYQGGDEPANREALWSSKYSTDGDLIKLVTAVNKARKVTMNAKSDYLSSAMTFASQSSSKSSMVVQKSGLIALLTNVGSSGSNTWKVDSTSFSEGTKLVDVISCSSVTTGSGGSISVSSSSGAPQVLIPESSLSGDSSICSGSSSGNGNGALGTSASWTLVMGVAASVGFVLTTAF